MNPTRRILSPSLALAFSAAIAFSASAIAAQTLQLTGRVLEKAGMDPVPGALVKWSGSNLSALTDSLGRFTLSGSPSAIMASLRFSAPYFRAGYLRVETSRSGQSVTVASFDTQGKRLGYRRFDLPDAGSHELPITPGTGKNGFLGFVTVRCEGQEYRFKVWHNNIPVLQTQASFALSATRALRKASAIGRVEVSRAGLLGASVGVTAATQDLGDIVLGYPARAKLGVGAATPYGATILFDGTHGKAAARQELDAKWKAWWRFNVTGHPPVTQIMFKVAKDPEFPQDSNRVTLRTCCETTPSNWGYNDIQAIAAHGDAQVHVEFMTMGKYDGTDTENPDTNSACSATGQNCFVNSGVFVQSRYEVQIMSVPLKATGLGDHDFGGIAHNYAPLSNQSKPNGVWQAYDITFRTARYSGATSTANGHMTVWWNGVQTHLNREVTRDPGAGVANHSGENVNDTLYGLKLQDELGDVRYRNIWIKKLKIDSTGTNFGY